ncbi:helix-turn-helix domain-containing protein [Novosphingobium piscinae]|uniref:Helix-turn-helix transcriptional regulator n=1 Tax=Novosphingobium piscinae TaxID=1507448 RepID=A0A7X1FYY6_9SPHN|nr:helix-turn-helix transcriptional regulator [Novosphingobium piscinae]MBC2669546.1 helix-turn-helix transcriptional regulator [Novosphingobium piscinae]
MIAFGPMSVTLLLCSVQGLMLAALLWRSRFNRAAGRWLALLIIAVAALITPYTIGYAGFYDRWPWLSFAPLSFTLAFGPLLYGYTAALIGLPVPRAWPHFVPVTVQFLAYALVFPFPLSTKNWWNTIIHAPIIDPAFDIAALVSIAAYSAAAWRAYRGYRRWLDQNRTDGVDFDPVWIRNFLAALLLALLVWAGFLIAKQIDPTRDYFDQFPLYVGFSGLVIYLGIGGWRHSATPFPSMEAGPLPEEAEPPDMAAAATPSRDWAQQGQAWLARIDNEALWRDPALTLAGLARILGTNTTYLSRGLGAAAGENFNAVINRRRVAELQTLLQAPGEARDLLALAFAVGFNSKASFNRAFKEFAGMSPSSWRLKSQKLQMA